MTIIAIIITLLYLILIGSFVVAFDKVETFQIKDIPAKTKFTVIIPFRNESEKLPDLLKSISKLNYPNDKFEVLFVDDESSDDSNEIIQKFADTGFSKENLTQTNIKIIQNKRVTNSPKKDAITLAIASAKNEWIITTDADCVLQKYWLDSFDCYIQNNTVQCIAAPVTYIKTNTFLKQFQALDILSLQGATIGGFGIKKPFLCNGANFAYKVSFFKLLNGFQGNTDIASGDDIFLLEKAIKQNKIQVHYLKTHHATVFTDAQPCLKSLIHQRIRWAAKTSSYSNWFGKISGFIVLLMNALLVCFLVLVAAELVGLKVFAYLFIIKFCIDFLLLFKVVRFFNQEHLLKAYPISSIIYPFFSLYIAVLSTFKGYKWKNRTFKK